ncbi:unnamed protein product [Closterium sp. Yama58-4]|nr:unnamed protein product [Closterium sp. Yama58-4]
MGCIQSKPDSRSRVDGRNGDGGDGAGAAASTKERRGQSRGKGRAKTVSMHGKPKKRDPAAAATAAEAEGKEEQAGTSDVRDGATESKQPAAGYVREESDGGLPQNHEPAEGAVDRKVDGAVDGAAEGAAASGVRDALAAKAIQGGEATTQGAAREGGLENQRDGADVDAENGELFGGGGLDTGVWADPTDGLQDGAEEFIFDPDVLASFEEDLRREREYQQTLEQLLLNLLPEQGTGPDGNEEGGEADAESAKAGAGAEENGANAAAGEAAGDAGKVASAATQGEDAVVSKEEPVIEEKPVVDPGPPPPPPRSQLLESFEQRCPPGGSDAVVVYTTTLRAVRKTFEDCVKVKNVLQALRVVYEERDISMRVSYRQELKTLMAPGAATPAAAAAASSVPRLFICGRYIGDADTVLQMYDDYFLAELIEGLPTTDDDAGKTGCGTCGGSKVVTCRQCGGNHKVVTSYGMRICSHCDDTGHVPCHTCGGG